MKIIPLRTCRSSTRGLPRDFGKYWRSRSTCASDSQKRSLIIPPHFESLNHVASCRSNRFMGPDSSCAGVCSMSTPHRRDPWHTGTTSRWLIGVPCPVTIARTGNVLNRQKGISSSMPEKPRLADGTVDFGAGSCRESCRSKDCGPGRDSP